MSDLNSTCFQLQDTKKQFLAKSLPRLLLGQEVRNHFASSLYEASRPSVKVCLVSMANGVQKREDDPRSLGQLTKAFWKKWSWNRA